jgi:hypothetical protein
MNIRSLRRKWARRRQLDYVRAEFLHFIVVQSELDRAVGPDNQLLPTLVGHRLDFFLRQQDWRAPYRNVRPDARSPFENAVIMKSWR